MPNTHSKFPEPIVRLGDSLDGPGDPEQVFLIFRESQIDGLFEQLEVLERLRNAAETWRQAEYDHGQGSAYPDVDAVDYACEAFWDVLESLATVTGDGSGETLPPIVEVGEQPLRTSTPAISPKEDA